jgi:hypothetical protein
MKSYPLIHFFKKYQHLKSTPMIAAMVVSEVGLSSFIELEKKPVEKSGRVRKTNSNTMEFPC